MDYKAEVKKLSQKDENNKCMDCNTPNPHWASTSIGIFICLECASQHRSYGVRISRVKSVNMDNWNEELYKIMQNGGNKKFRIYLEDKGLESKDKKEIYMSDDVKQYRISLCGPEKEPEIEYKSNTYYQKREERKEKPAGKYDWIGEMVVNKAILLKDKSIEISSSLHTNVLSPAYVAVKDKASALNEKLFKKDKNKIETVESNNNNVEVKEKRVNFSKWD
ncbi:Zn finger-containing GTPase- Activating Protein for ARF [Binucleata daphniae]